MSTKQLIVYADLNCPFCFALHERLLRLGQLHLIEWRTIEHAPKIAFSTTDFQMQSELTSEVTKVRQVAADVNIIVPPGRPNTHLAIELVQAAYKIDPEKALQLRIQIYQALWYEGLDFSNETLLARFVSDVGLPPLTVNASVRQKLDSWQDEWEHGDYSRNIPALVTTDGNKLLGLPNPEVLNTLLEGKQTPEDFLPGAVCHLKPKEKILIVSFNDDNKSTFNELFQSEYRLDYVNDFRAVITHCLSFDAPDLVVIDCDKKNPRGFDICQNIKNQKTAHNIPIILLSEDRSTEQELKAFQIGATDFIAKPFSPAILNARARVLLQLKRTTDLLEQYARLDGLTEIANRREYERVMEIEWRRSIRNRRPVSLILLDVDHFKLYNDNYGHVRGDQCLIRVAKLIDQSIRKPPDMVARYGGEEFVVILPETDLIGATIVATTISDNLARLAIAHDYSPLSKRVTISQGVVSTIPLQGTSLKAFVNAADKALYQAKNNGRNCAVRTSFE